jgi:pimeloyl-ACP methyl ester carboxylesterase
LIDYRVSPQVVVGPRKVHRGAAKEDIMPVFLRIPRISAGLAAIVIVLGWLPGTVFGAGSDTQAAPLVRGQVLARRIGEDAAQAYFLYIPHQLESGARLFVTVHGISRNAAEHAARFAPFAEKYGVVLVAPLFPADRFPDYQRLGLKSADEQSRLALERIIGEVGALTGADTGKIYLFGHSGGGQFVHRYAMSNPQRVAKYVVSAAGWYTLPDPSLSYPVGIGSPTSLPNLAFDPSQFLRLPACVMVGERDVKRDRSLRVSKLVDSLEGETRLQRAKSWVSAMSRAAEARGLATAYELHIVPRADHKFSHMMGRGAMGGVVFDCLFGADTK